MTQLICVLCPRGCHLSVDEEQGFAVTGNTCPRGAEYGKAELTNPTRVVTSTVRIEGAVHRRCPVKTDRPIPKGAVFDAMRALEEVELIAPVRPGQTVAEHVCGTEARFVTTRAMEWTSE